MKPGDFAERLTAFLTTYLAGTRNLSGNTILSYRDSFALLLRFLRDEKGIPVEKVDLDTINAPTLLEWLDHLEKVRRYSARSRNQRMAAIRTFFRYLAPADPARVHQLQMVLAIPPARTQRPTIGYLDPELLAAILSQPDVSTLRGRRDAVLLSLLYDTGARSQEIVDLRVRDVRLDPPAQVTLTGKGRKARVVPLMPTTAGLLRAHLQWFNLDRPSAVDAPVFAGRNGAALTRSGLRSLLAKHVDAARKSHPALQLRIGPHTLRHTKAMHMLQAGVGLIHIRDILGHVDIKTTEIYARANLEMKRKALSQAANAPNAVPRPTLPAWSDNKDLLDWLTSL